MKRVMILGGCGFIGSNLAKALSKEGITPTVYDDLSLGKLENLDGCGYTFYKGSVTDFETLKAKMAGHDTVVHLAALSRIQPSIDRPRQSHDVNLTGTLNVLEAARQNKVEQVIFASSSSIFGKTATMPIREDDPKNPGSPYSCQKLMGEVYCGLYSSLYGLKTTVLRFFNAFGENMPVEGEYAVVAGIFLNQKARGLPLTIKGDGSQLRDFTYVGDICQGIILAAKKRQSGTFHLGTGNNVSINLLANTIDPNGQRTYIEASKGDYPATLADISKASTVLGYKPTIEVLSWCRMMANDTSTTLPKDTKVVYSTTEKATKVSSSS